MNAEQARRASWTAPAGAHGGVSWQLPLAACLGLLIAGAVLLAPAEVAIGLALLGFFLVLALYDTWSMVLFLMLTRGSMDILSDTGVVGGQNVSSWLALLLVGVGLAHIATNRVDLKKVPLATPFMALLGAWGLGVIVSVDPVTSFQDWLRALGTFLLFVYLVDALRDRERRQVFLKVIVLSATVPVGIGLYQLVTGTGNEATEGFNRIFGTFVHPSPFAFYLLVILPPAAVLYFRSQEPGVRLGAGILCLAIAVCIVATFTRIAWLGFLVTLLVMALARSRTSLLVLPAIAAFAILLVPGAEERLFGDENLDTGDTRLAVWGEALSYTSAAQLPAGLGLGSVEELAGIAAHNDYVRLWIETGIIGVAAFAWLYVSVLRLAVRAARSGLPGYGRPLASAFLAVFIARLIMMLTDNLMVHPVIEWYFWAFAALIVALQLSRPAAVNVRTGHASGGATYSSGTTGAR